MSINIWISGRLNWLHYPPEKSRPNEWGNPWSKFSSGNPTTWLITLSLSPKVTHTCSFRACSQLCRACSQLCTGLVLSYAGLVLSYAGLVLSYAGLVLSYAGTPTNNNPISAAGKGQRARLSHPLTCKKEKNVSACLVCFFPQSHVKFIFLLPLLKLVWQGLGNLTLHGGNCSN